MSWRVPRVEYVSPARTASKKAEAGNAGDDKPTLMLLDGNSLAYRAFYALPAENFKTQGGLTTNAVYGFTAMLINLLRDESPTHVAAAFDVSRQTFRSERYPEYKANRSSTPDEFRGQIDITKEVLAALGITVLAEPGFEADDLIATLTTQAEKEGYQVLVVSGDRDSLQLVSDDVTVLYPRKGVSELTRFTPAAVVEKINGAVNEGLKTSEVLDAFRRLGFEAKSGTPQEFKIFLDAELAKWPGLLAAAGIKAQ